MATAVDRRGPLWFVLGALLGPVALIVIQAAPPGRCRTCGAPTRYFQRTCWWCHEDVRSSPATTLAIVERMSQRTAGPGEPVELEPEPEPVETFVAPKPFVIRSEASPQPFRLAGPSPRARVKSTREPARVPEGAGRSAERIVGLGSAATTAAVVPAAAGAPEREPAAVPERPQNAASPVPDAPPASAREAVTKPLAAAQSLAPESPTPYSGPLVPARYQTGRSAADAERPTDALQLLATAVFVAGSARLEPGRRYTFGHRPGRLLVLGPTDMDPAAVVLDRAIGAIEVRSLDGRLILSEPGSGSGLVLAFMAVSGTSTERLASTIADAARAAGGD